MRLTLPISESNSSHEHISFCGFRDSLCSQINEEVSSHLKDASVAIKDYQEVTNDIKTLSASGKKLWIDPAKVVHITPPLPPLRANKAFGMFPEVLVVKRYDSTVNHYPCKAAPLISIQYANHRNLQSHWAVASLGCGQLPNGHENKWLERILSHKSLPALQPHSYLLDCSSWSLE